MMDRKTKQGSCHCGRITFEADLSDEIVAHACNCSICHMVGFQHVIVPPDHFRLVTGTDDIETYTFNTGYCETQILPHLRRQAILHAAVQSRWDLRQPALP